MGRLKALLGRLPLPALAEEAAPAGAGGGLGAGGELGVEGELGDGGELGLAPVSEAGGEPGDGGELGLAPVSEAESDTQSEPEPDGAPSWRVLPNELVQRLYAHAVWYVLALFLLLAGTLMLFAVNTTRWKADASALPYKGTDLVSSLVTNGDPDAVGTGVARVVGEHDSPELEANIELASWLLNGAGVANGEEFSLLNTLGDLNEVAGWQEAWSLVGDEPGERLAGGVEVLASALYDAALEAGLKPVERHALKFVPGFVSPGLDASVWSAGADDRGDLVLRNDTGAYVEFRAKASGTAVTVEALSYLRTTGESREVEARVLGSFVRAASGVYDDPSAHGLAPDSSVQFYTVETRVLLRRNGEVSSQEIVSQDIYQLPAAS